MSPRRETWWTGSGGEEVRARFATWRTASLRDFPGIVSSKRGRSRERAVFDRAALGLPGPGKILVKIYRPRNLRKALFDRLEHARAEREWRNAHAAAAAGVGTILPLAAARSPGLVAEASLVAYPFLEGHGDVEAFLARRGQMGLEEFLRQKRRLLGAIGRGARRIHDRGIEVSDFHAQQFLFSWDELARGEPAPLLLDLERARLGEPVSARARRRMLVRLDTTLREAAMRSAGGLTAADRLRVLEAYFEAGNPFEGRRHEAVRGVIAAGSRRFRGKVRERAGAAGLPHAGLAGEPVEKLPVSCFIVCFDEEDHIRDCLESVRWCDEIVIVDSFSQDRTREICGEYTDRIIQRKWPGFVEQKRFALEQTRNEWVLNLDADERVSPELRDEIAREIRRNDPDAWGYYVPRLVWYLGRWWRRGWYPEYRLRLFRQSRVTWGGVDPHERAFLEDEKRARKLEGDLLHLTYDDLGDHIRTINRFSTIGAREMMDRGKKPRLWNFFVNPFVQFLRFYFVKRGFREGIVGFFVAVLVAANVFLKYAKLWDLARVADERARGEKKA